MISANVKTAAIVFALCPVPVLIERSYTIASPEMYLVALCFAGVGAGLAFLFDRFRAGVAISALSAVTFVAMTLVQPVLLPWPLLIALFAPFVAIFLRFEDLAHQLLRAFTLVFIGIMMLQTLSAAPTLAVSPASYRSHVDPD